MYTFNPFNKEFEEITPEDLNILFEVAEGWYVEYKREVPSKKIKNIAKSISSFSNQYGGWLFYGVDENKDSRVAGGFPGINIDQIHTEETRIRNAVVSHLNPKPFYKIKVLKGPCQKINLGPSRGVIVIYVPSGSNPPYIHSSGVIYRRVGDSSEPTEETDRFILKQLWEKGKKNQEYLKSRVLESWNNTEETEIGFLVNIFLIKDLYDNNVDICKSEFSFEDFSKLMKEEKGNFFNIRFDNLSTTNDGYIARVVHDNSFSNFLPTLRYSSRITKISIPVSSIKIINDTMEWINIPWNYSYIKPFSEMINTLKLKNATIIDLNNLFWLLWMFMRKYKFIMDAECFKDDFHAKILLENTHNIIPYLDSKSYIEFIKKNMIPLVQENSIIIPNGFNYEDYLKINNFQIIEYDNMLNTSQKTDISNDMYAPQLIFTIILKSLGLPIDVTSDSMLELIPKTIKIGFQGNSIYHMNLVIDKSGCE